MSMFSSSYSRALEAKVSQQAHLFYSHNGFLAKITYWGAIVFEKWIKQVSKSKFCLSETKIILPDMVKNTITG